MDTSELIRTLAADARQPSPSLAALWWAAVATAVALAAVLFLVLLGPRPDIGAAVETPRFLFKFVFTITLAASAFAGVRVLSHPGDDWRKAVFYLAAAPALLAMAVLLELLALPAGSWRTAMIGTNSIACLTYIPLMGLAPLALFLQILRHGAPTRPAFAGAVAGLLAGGIAATFYAAQCTDDSPLFVATWYTIAILGLALLGAAGAARLVRW